MAAKLITKTVSVVKFDCGDELTLREGDEDLSYEKGKLVLEGVMEAYIAPTDLPAVIALLQPFVVKPKAKSSTKRKK